MPALVFEMSLIISGCLPDNLTLADEIARGEFCIVRRCIDIRTKAEFSAKITYLERPGTASSRYNDVEREVRICCKLHHPHIAELLGAYHSFNEVYLISELMEGSNLCVEIVKRANSGFVYSEAVASHYMRQVLEAVAHCHANQIIHRDVKPDNIQLLSNDDDAPIKLIDFSLAVELPEKGHILADRIGTPHFMSPEVVDRRPHREPVDVWGCGVMLYILLSGSLPFNGIGDQIFSSVSSGVYKMNPKQWDSISTSAKDLVAAMLEHDPDKRISAQQALEHPWLKERDKYAHRSHLHETVQELKKFNARQKLKNEVLAAAAARKFTRPVDRQLNENKISEEVVLDATEDNDLTGIDKVNLLVEALDVVRNTDIALDSDLHFIQSLFMDRRLQAMLEIHSLAQKVTQTYNSADLIPCAVTAAQDVLSDIDRLGNPNYSCRKLRDVLQKPHVLALLKCHDATIKELQGVNDHIYVGSPFHDIPDTMADTLTRVRLVQFTRNTDEPMGITLKLNEKKHCVVARVIHGGMIHRQGTLHVGDEIREINGVLCASKSLETLQAVLREVSGDVTMKIVPSLKPDEVSKKEEYVRCLFDYDPRSDDMIPCQQAGMKFKCGDVLQIASKADQHWWQARKAEDKHIAGLIPSPELQELRIAAIVAEKSKKDGDSKCIWPRKKVRSRDSRYAARHNTAFDKLELVAYEEVAYAAEFKRKTVVLIGAHGVGRRHIKNFLISRLPEKYAYPVPHTSRKPAEGEVNGQNWHFCSEESMLADVAKNNFLEYGTHDGAMFGIKLDSIRDIIKSGKTAILDVETPALKVLRCSEFSPYIVFISSPASFPHSGDPIMDASLQRLVRASEDLRDRYRHLFDLTIVNNAIEDAVEDLIFKLQALDVEPQWVPVSWLL